ncbi:hypothetical protein CVT24_009278, partial [Panaeolus cyanescens]
VGSSNLQFLRISESIARLAFIVYWGVVLFGYDTTALILENRSGGVVSNEHFGRSFGIIDSSGVKDIHKSNAISSNVVSVLQAGAFFGALGSAPISSRMGRRFTLLCFSIVFSVGAILTTVAGGGKKGLNLIYVGRVISGVGIGAISAVAPAYVSECSPKEVRGRITGLFQIMVTGGVMVSYFTNLGVQLHLGGDKVWRVPFGLQLIPAGILAIGLLTVKESPRYLASVERNDEALQILAYLRREPITSHAVLDEMAEIEAAIREEREARKGLGLKEAFFGKGNFIRFVIAFVVFLFQQLTGQNSVNYYAPQIFASLGYTGTKQGLLASGIYGIVKVVTTSFFVFFGVETLGRKLSFFISAMGMGTSWFIVGSILKTHPPNVIPGQNPPPASKAMAAMLYIYVAFYAMGWGPLPWIYVADIFPTRTRHFGLSVASASQWLWNFVISKLTPDMVTSLGYKMFLMFASFNVGALGLFSILIPETKGRSLEEMDIIFGAISAEQRQADVEKVQRGELIDFLLYSLLHPSRLEYWNTTSAMGEAFDLDGTLGAAFLGTLAAAMVLDTVHMGFTTHGLYHYLVTNFGNYTVLVGPTCHATPQDNSVPSLYYRALAYFVTFISECLTYADFPSPEYKYNHSSLVLRKEGVSLYALGIILPGIIVLLSLVVFANGCGFASRAFVLKTYEKMNEAAAMLYVSFGAAVVADGIIASSLCTLLLKSKTGFKSTDSIVAKLMAFSINTGLLTR